jgi:hypothetical protein
MIIEKATDKRELKTVEIGSDWAIIGSGLSGVCTAITAA